MNDVEAVFNYARISDRIATSGQPGSDEFKIIAAAGFTSVVNLAMHDSEGAIREEGHLVTQSGMSYFHIPVPFDVPTATHLRYFIQLMDMLEGEKVWVHCAMNYRVSAFMFCYLKRVKGYAEEEARSPIFDFWQPDAVWQQFMRMSSDEIGL
ncbi:MAG TPA: phosphatase [Chromatiales bacterium]|nr:phosphatase [Thiotrichales bacterium]HIP67005.1 phosphatase [Chromatiales bacterium]